MDLCFRGEGLIHGLWYQPMYSLRELGKGALFWEEAALQVHHLATDCHYVENKGPFLLVGSGSCYPATQEAWQVECQLDFALLLPTAGHLCGVQELYKLTEQP